MVSIENGVIALIDMDCFYVQVEQRDQPELWGKPVAVIQYNQWKGGALIAVSYEARAEGVKRGSMRGDEAKEKCPSLTLVSVPTNRGKADLTKYRQASSQVFQVMANHHPDIIVERASVDEAYLDLTKLIQTQMREIGFEKPVTENDLPTTHIMIEEEEGEERNDMVKRWIDVHCLEDPEQLALAMGAKVVEKIRSEILKETQFHCSAGIGHNKTLAKLVCSKHKPKQQTIIPEHFVPELFQNVDIHSVRNLGGKLGHQLVEKFNFQTMHQLSTLPKFMLEQEFGQKTGNWLYLLAKGIDHEEVKARDLAKSVAVGKNFMGKQSLTTSNQVKHWLGLFCEELSERLFTDKAINQRTAKTLVVGLKNASDESFKGSSTRQTPLLSYCKEELMKTAFNLLLEFNKQGKQAEKWIPPVINLSIAAGRFEDGVDVQSYSITDYYSTKIDDQQPSTSSANLVAQPQQCSTPEPLEVEEGTSTVSKGSLINQSAATSGPTSSYNSPPIKDGTYLPKDMSEIDEETFSNLPPSIQFELRGYYNTKNGKISNPTTRDSCDTFANKPKSANKTKSAPKRPTPEKLNDDMAAKCYKVTDFYKKS